MALVKTSKISAEAGAPGPSPAIASYEAPHAQPRPRGRAAELAPAEPVDRLSQRVAAATEELASGLTEASAAAEELGQSMRQIASGAEEAAGASQEQLSALRRVASNLSATREQAEASRRRADIVEVLLADAAAQVSASVRSVERNAERQQTSIGRINELSRRAQDVSAITQTVARLSDQTNLLALNAAIEAARAGDHGRGFAVVADEVRALAENSETRARAVQDLAGAIQADVREVVEAVQAASEKAMAEARAGATLIETFEAIRSDMTAIAAGSLDTLTVAGEAERASIEAQRGAEQVASAAEQQSAASSQSQSAIEQQSTSLNQGQIAAQSLAALADSLRQAQNDAGKVAQIGATAEELSATIQELSSAASEILAAIEQIDQGSRQQAAAAHQSSAALAQIQATSRRAETNASRAHDRVVLIGGALSDSRASAQRLIDGISSAHESAQASLAVILRLEGVSRKIEKIVDAITLVVVQTSMLAVSGSVEAARAGEAGRGFELVSNDIRNLAREASESLENVKDTVRGIIDHVVALQRDHEQMIAVAEAEAQNSRGVVAALEKVEANTRTLSESNRAILTAMQEILAAAGEISDGSGQIATAAEEASAAARQAAVAANQQARGAEDLAAAIEEIASLADELKQQDG
ncbi:MAG: chemotaxis protein [Hyphomicrobiales bacterium]|nr:chemotaxis protein [Hyphomicrobiales bacterium]